MTVVRPVDAHGLENGCERVDFAQKVLRGESALAQLLGQRVRRGRNRDPAFDQLREQPRDQRRVARVVEFELVDAHHHVVGQQLDALDETEDAGQLGQFAERRERRRRRRRRRNPVVARRQQVGLADTEAAVEVEPDARQRLALAEQLLPARPPRHRLVAEPQAGLHRRGLRRLGRIGLVAVEADVGERRRRVQLGDQPLRGDARVPIDETADTTGVHARTLTTCCNRPHARRRRRDAIHGCWTRAESLDESRLTDLYAYPDDLRSCWVRGNMITSLDGGATDDGKSGGLAGPGDRAVFTHLRQLADVVLVGAGTVRAENYSGAQFSPAQRQARQRRGQAEVPPIAVVTQPRCDRPRRQDLHPHRGAAADPHLAEAVADARRRLGSVAEVIDASGPNSDRVDAATVLTILADRGLFRVLAEGGPQFLGLLIEHDLLDELCLTVAPLLVGGAASRIATGDGQVHTGMRRSHLLTDDAGYLYTRYVRGT